jgi:hypothetical protein
MVRDVLMKSKNGTPFVGQQIKAQTSDGEIIVGTVRVRAQESGTPDLPKFVVGTRYLLFLENFNGSGVYYPTHVPVIVDHGRLTYSVPDEEPNQIRNPLEAHTYQEVTRVIRESGRHR